MKALKIIMASFISMVGLLISGGISSVEASDYLRSFAGQFIRWSMEMDQRMEHI
jgi:hypothetical protein